MKNAAPFGAARRELPFHSLPPEEADGKAGADGGRGQHDRGARRSPDPLPQPITLRTVFYRAGAGGLSTVSAVFRRSGDQKAVDAFLPGGVCTRAQTAALLYRFALAMGMDVSVGEDTNILSYDDALGLGEWAVPAVQWACGAGVLQGSGSRLLPDAPCTRAQMAAFLYRALAGPDIGRKLRKFAEMRRNTAEGPRGPSPFVRDMYVAVFHSRASPPVRSGRAVSDGERAALP